LSSVLVRRTETPFSVNKKKQKKVRAPHNCLARY
jgi:hypothetical protein